jgi:hypothetical protein
MKNVISLNKIQTSNGNFFVFEASEGLEFAKGPGHYITPAGTHIKSVESAEVEIEDMFEKWNPKPEIVSVSVVELDLFKRFFTEDGKGAETEGNLLPVIGMNKESTHNPFADLGQMLQEKGD